MAGILLEGYYGNDNLGDDCILLSILNSINKSKNDIYFVDVRVSDSEYLGYSELFSSFNIKIGLYGNYYEGGALNRLKCFRKKIKKYDFWIIGGGGLFPGERFKVLVRELFKIKCARMSGVKVCMYGIEINPVHKRINRFMWKKIINNTDFIATRNFSTKAFLDSVREKNNIAFSDVTFLLKDPDKYDAQLVCQKNGIQGDYELWCPAIPWTETELKDEKYRIRYRKICEQFARLLEHSNYENIVFLPFYGGGVQGDSTFIKDILVLSPAKKNYIVIDDSQHLSFYEKRMMFQNAKKCLCMRYHSVLFALYFSDPFIAVSYSPKTSLLLHEIGLEDIMIEFGIRNSDFFYKEFDMDYDELLDRYLNCEIRRADIEKNSGILKKKAQEGEAVLLRWLENKTAR